MPTPQLIFVGGFLGAGKTTLLAQAARRLSSQGHRVGLITNDQAAGLVDTHTLRATGAAVGEVAGGCFCCRFEDLVGAMDEIVAEHAPDFLIGEPVGSCTDLSATVIQPAQKLLGDRFRVAPFTVLIDPQRAWESLPAGAKGPFPQSVVYIFRKQLEEADIIALNKVEQLPADELQKLTELLALQFPGKAIVTMSALSGDGVDAWLARLAQGGAAGRNIAEVDYDIYAGGEAALGWLNAAVHLRAVQTVDWRRFCHGLMCEIQNALRAEAAEIAHLKLRLTADRQSIVGNLTSTAGTPSFQGTISGHPAEALLIVNLRAQVEPEWLKSTVQHCLATAGGAGIQTTIDAIRCFAPARPEPTHRFAAK